MSNFAFHKALVPVNASDLSDRVILKAAELAGKGFVEKLVILSVWEADKIDYTKLHAAEKAAEMKAKAQAVLDAHKTHLNAKSVEAEYILAGGDPADIIINCVEKGDYDLIIMGSRKLNKLQEIIYGSVSDRVTRLVSIPIFVVK
jgi:nucleotide-binding universal stress UspA family protein